MRLVVATTLCAVLAIAPALAREVKQSTLDFRKQYHSRYCPGKAACNVCEVRWKGQFNGHCTLPKDQLMGEPCRCASTEGWQKGIVMKLDPVDGWLYQKR
ncbi:MULTISPECIES: hypothetical protein [unclassified Devosia]|jgi:hypothetical protein|uniref:hypothetical protein n=1 Tax=unclassified Devosia TaxID=196773 RepID=UPI000869ABB2|nr:MULTISPECIES: hypothetical protein [unclassified Devosia]MBN9360311.1 hypothetical protein [Devosia sp.]ODS94291.1 MAG: hypothetical protein ABS47_06365 [Devosia sp. SCN 66-27]OJX22333.1 MAG: hypothetical protein BGO83_15980 [Devosia sp. 66-14]